MGVTSLSALLLASCLEVIAKLAHTFGVRMMKTMKADARETVLQQVRMALASGVTARDQDESNLQSVEDAGVWVAGYTIDTSAATESLHCLLSYQPFADSLVRHSKSFTWVNIHQRNGADAPPQDEMDLRAHLGAERWQGLRALAEAMMALPESGPLAVDTWELESYGYILSAPGTTGQGIHIDYDRYQNVGLVQLNGHTDPRATTQYLIVEGGDNAAERAIEMGSSDEGGQVDIDALFFDASVGAEPEGGIEPIHVTVKRGPRQPHRPYILKAGTLHRGSGNPPNAEYRIAFTVSYVPKGIPPFPRESIWESDGSTGGRLPDETRA